VVLRRLGDLTRVTPLAAPREPAELEIVSSRAVSVNHNSRTNRRRAGSTANRRRAGDG